MHLFNAFKYIKRHDGIWHIQKIFLPVNQNVGFSQLLILIKIKSARDSNFQIDAQQNSGRPKQVNTETTETEISVRFAEPKPKLPNRNSTFQIH